jgi:hypothetical protein
MLSAPRGSLGRLLGVAVLIGTAGSAGASERADRGISMSAWVGAALDRSVAAARTGQAVHDAAAVVGATTVGNIEWLAMGGSVDATPGTLGNGRLSLSLLLGYQAQIAQTRLQLLAEGGNHRFSDVGGIVSAPQLGGDTWLPFAGVRVSAARTVPAHGLLEVGLSLFARHDIGQKTVTSVGGVMGEETRTDYRVGGYMAGLALQVGLRLDSPHPWNQGFVGE